MCVRTRQIEDGTRDRERHADTVLWDSRTGDPVPCLILQSLYTWVSVLAHITVHGCYSSISMDNSVVWPPGELCCWPVPTPPTGCRHRGSEGHLYRQCCLCQVLQYTHSLHSHVCKPRPLTVIVIISKYFATENIRPTEMSSFLVRKSYSV